MPTRFTAALLIALAACTGGPPRIVAADPGSVTLRWYSGDATLPEAAALAGRYCAGRGKTARFNRLERDGSAVIGRYRCA